MGEVYSTHRKVYSICIGNPERKRSFGTLRRTWEDNIRMHLR